MINEEVALAFDMLLEETERIIPELNAQGKEMMETKKYAEAHAVITSAEAVVAFQAKVRTLAEEWKVLNSPATEVKQAERNKRTMKKPPSPDLIRGQRTHEKQFALPILQALVDFGGIATKNQVLEQLEITMADKLNQTDWQTLTSRHHEIRWKVTAAWARQGLVNEGFLAKGSPIGLWEISPAGRNYLDSHRQEITSIEQASPSKIAERSQQAQKHDADFQPYDLSMHLLRKPRATVRLFESLRSVILSYWPDVQEIIRKVHISYQVRGKTFAEIHIQKSAIKIWVFVPMDEIQQSQSICRDVSNLGHHGTGPTEITMTVPGQLAFVSEIIQKSSQRVLGTDS